MSVVVFALGILLAAAGLGLIGFGIPINDLSLGGTLILAGTVALVGGILMVGLSAVVAELARVAGLLRASQAARPARAVSEAAAPAKASAPAMASAPAVSAPAASAPAVLAPAASAPAAETVTLEPRVEPKPTVVSTPSMEVSSTVIERMRTSIPRAEKPVPEAEEVPLSPNGQQTHPVEPRHDAVPRAEPPPRAAGAAAVETREPRLDFLFRPRQARPAPQQQEAFDALWPKRPVREPQVDSRQEVARSPAAMPAAAPVMNGQSEETVVAEVQPAPHAAPAHPASQPAPLPPPEPSTQAQRSVAILKSGVVDGMAYTLYADGSIEAQLPQGTVRFGSIAELRAHIENHS